MQIRPATQADAEGVWRVLEPVIRAGETYPLPRDWGRGEALAYWFAPGHRVFVAEGAGEAGAILGTYYMKANQPGAGGHVANCGYMTAAEAQGRGIGRAMCEHSFQAARELGFTAMQYNLVVATNRRAVHLWQACGMEIAGRLPGAFIHPVHGAVDALVMYRRLVSA